MTPEELKEFREWCRTFEVSADSMIMKALTHIDQQATALDEAEALIKKNADQINALLAQVAALQEIAIDQLAENNYDFEYNMDNIGKYFWQRDEKIQKKFLDDARRQLSEEHPEVFR